MNTNTLNHLAYLEQVANLLEDKHKPLAARLGFIAKKISAKHVVRSEGSDAPKLRRCKACQAPITCDNVKCKAKQLVVKCPLCDLSRKFSVSNRATKVTAIKNEKLQE